MFHTEGEGTWNFPPPIQISPLRNDGLYNTLCISSPSQFWVPMLVTPITKILYETLSMWMYYSHLHCNFHIAEGAIRHLLWVEHLPLEHPKAPDVRCRGELALGDTLRGHPSHRTRHVGMHLIDGVIFRYLAKKTKISHFACFVVSYKNVAGCQVLWKYGTQVDKSNVLWFTRILWLQQQVYEFNSIRKDNTCISVHIDWRSSKFTFTDRITRTKTTWMTMTLPWDIKEN